MEMRTASTHLPVAASATVLAASALAGAAQVGGTVATLRVDDGSGHGDPPFLLEDGSRPLLNGKDLEGWTYRTPERQGWIATRGVV